MCQQVYFPTDDCSAAYVTIVNTGLWEMFSNFGERELELHKIDKLELDSAKVICKRSLDSAARHTPLLLDHSYRQIQALLLLTLFLVETSRPALALSFVSACARLCQGAGYHCITFDSADPEAKQKIIIFWVVFVVDRGLSLSFGRSPTLQDYDVTSNRPTIAEAQGDGDLFLCSVGVDLAYLQGGVYQQLYSARAQTESGEVKAQRARVLAERLIVLRHEVLSFETGGDVLARNTIEVYDLLLKSHLVLIHKPVPSTHGVSPLHFCDECVAASRIAMEGYNSAWKKHQAIDDMTWRNIINWTYLFSPFTSFIVLFGTVVTTKSGDDLHLMEASVATLKSASQYSTGIAKLHDACEKFYNLATAFMAQTFRNTESHGMPPQQQPPMEDVDLASLYRQDWNAMLDDWDLGLGGQNAREMSTFLSGSSYL